MKNIYWGPVIGYDDERREDYYRDWPIFTALETEQVRAHTRMMARFAIAVVNTKAAMAIEPFMIAVNKFGAALLDVFRNSNLFQMLKNLAPQLKDITNDAPGVKQRARDRSQRDMRRKRRPGRYKWGGPED